jgi:hypothetical protein
MSNENKQILNFSKSIKPSMFYFYVLLNLG